MELIHTTEDLVYLYHLKNLLETAGVETLIQNDRLATLSGEIPMTNCWPELWLLDGSKIKLARKIINEAKAPFNDRKETDGSVWVCKNCGEEHPAQFSECWNCHGEAYKAF